MEKMNSKEDLIGILRANLYDVDPYVKDTHFFVVMGASGDLAKKKIYPTLWMLYRDQLLPSNTFFVGYARSNLTVENIKTEILKHTNISGSFMLKFEEFMKRNYYVKGNYTDAEEFRHLRKKLLEINENESAHVIFYLALPPSVYSSVSALISENCRPKKPGYIRLIVEKPFGRDLKTSDELNMHLRKYYEEDEIYRIDHYLGKELVQSLLMVRFANEIFTRLWNRDSIECVMITFKEKIGTYGRGGYFDEYGIIRDVMQNHLLQIMTLIAMEPPVSLDANHIRDEKVKVLRSVLPVDFKNIVIGQYVGDPEGPTDDSRMSYTDDPKVAKNSRTPTYACVVFYVQNERWDGVPFILKCGKAMNEHKTEIRIQFRDAPLRHLFEETGSKIVRNEFVIRIQPDEAIYLKVMNKKPGREFLADETELDLTYFERYTEKLPEAYERLLMDVFTGIQSNFVRNDELHEAWRLFTPLLEHIKNIEPLKYKFGVRGIEEADKLCARVGFVYRGSYKWPGARSSVLTL